MELNILPLMPEIFMAITAMGLLIVGVSRGNVATPVISAYSIVIYAITFIILLGLSGEKFLILNDLFVFDQFAYFMKLLILLGLGLSVALSSRYLQQIGVERFEYPILIMFAGLGMMMMVSAHNMLSLYMALELQSLSLYVLAAFQRNTVKSAEAGIKYFILGCLSSGMLLFGISLIYGFVGSLDFLVIDETLRSLTEMPLGVTVGLVFILAGLAFKISAVPFHMWTPDVYEGAPSSVTALFAIVPKVAAMGLLMRLLYEPFGSVIDQWGQIIYFIALASMVVGAFAGVAQDNIKRLLAYSSIGNMGYALIGIAVGTEQGASALVLYLLIYMLMTAGAFAVVITMRRNGKSCQSIDDLGGLSKTHPGLAYCMALLMFSMSGIPPLAGFFGKFAVFQAAVEAEHYVLAVLGVLTSVVAAYYYLRVVKVMFFDDAKDALEEPMPLARYVVLGISVAFIVAFIFKPSAFILGAQDAVSVFFAAGS